MSDYKVKIQVDEREASRKLSEIGKQVKEVTGEKELKFKLPNFSNLKRDLKEVAQYSGVAVQAFKQFTPIGKDIAEIEDNLNLVSMSLINVGRNLSALRVYANPIRGMGDMFYGVADAVNAVTINTAKLGFAIFGATQSVNLLKAAFGAAFDDTVGREIRLREQILQTATTLAGTNRLFAEGFEIEDPTEKLKALEQPINESIERIRVKSLEIAGTTSEAVISTFNIVAAQLGTFGGTLRDAESLAVKFAGALGTLGMSNPMYARQEVQSIMMGYIDQNSVLAKTLGITSEDIRKAKQSAGGLVEFLNKKLEVFEAGQAMAAKGFRGITSNIQELQEELKRAFGASLLDPILKRVEKFYETVSGQEAMKALMATSRSFGQLIGSTLNTALGAVLNTSVFDGIDSSALTRVAESMEKAFANASVYIQEQIERLTPAIQRIVERVGRTVAKLTESFAELAVVIAQLKFDQINIQLQAFATLSNVVLAAAQAYSYYLQTIQDIISTPLGRYINELVTTFKVLDQVGVIGLVKIGAAIRALFVLVPPLVAKFREVFTKIGAIVQQAASAIGATVKVVGNYVSAAVAKAVSAVTAGIVQILEIVGTLAAAIQALLTKLSVQFARSGGVLAALSAPLAQLASAFRLITETVDTANLRVRQFGINAQTSMGQAAAAADRASASFANVGKAAGAGLAGIGSKAGGIFAGLVGGIALATLKFIALMAAITLVFDGIRRLKERFDELGESAKAKQAIDLLNNGLRDQAHAAKAAGVELDAVTQKLYDNAVAATNSELTKAVDKYLELQNRIIQLRRAIEEDSPKMSLLGTLPQGGKMKALEAEAARLRAEIKRLEEEAKKNDPDKKDSSDPELRAQKRKDEIEAIAKFEKDARKAIEEEIYNYRRQAQDKEIEIWRQTEQLRIDQIDYQNRKLISGVRDSAKVSLDALLDWLGTKRRGELDLQEKQRRAQLAAADMERAIGKFRANLENQLVELRKKLGQWELEVLDRRIKGEQLIADIRNGSVVWTSAEQGQDAPGVLDPGRAGSQEVIDKALKATEDLTGVNERCAIAVQRFMSALGVNASVMNASAQSAERMGRVMTDWSQLRPGDIVARGKPGDPEHVGVYTGGNNVFHQSASQGLKTGNYGDLGWFKQQGYFVRPYASAEFSGMPSDSRARALVMAARELGVSPEDLAAIISYETGGTFNPSEWGGAGGNHMGLIQFGAHERKKYGAYEGQSFEEQVRGPVVRYLRDRFNSVNMSTQGASLATLYRTINGGNPLAPLTDHDGNGNIGQHIQRIEAHRAKARAFLGGNFSGSGGGGGRAGSAGLDAVGGMPDDNFVKLDIDTSELDTALDNLKKLNEELRKLAEQGAELESAKGFDRFLETLKGPEKALQKTQDELRLKQKELAEVAKQLAEGDFDRDKLQLVMEYEAQLQDLTDKHKETLDLVGKIKMTDEERKKVITSIEEQHKKNLAALKQTREEREKYLNTEKNIQRTTEMNLELQRRERALILDQVSARTEAAKAALGEDNYLGRRRLDAEATVYREWMERTENGRKPLDELGQAELQKLAEQAYASAEALAAVDEELADFAEKLNMAREMASGITDSYKNMVGSVLMGEDIKDAVAQMGRDVAGRMVGKALDYAFKPLEDYLEKTLMKAFGVDDAEKANTNALKQLTTSVDQLRQTIEAGAAGISPPEGGSPSTSGFTYGDGGVATQLPGMEVYTAKLPDLAARIKEAGAATTEGTENALTGMEKFTGGLASVATTALSIVGGIQQIKEGGAGNVLMGIGSIFTGIAGGLMGFGSIFRAGGGGVNMSQPKVVGENGPEVFIPPSNGRIASNSELRDAMSGSRESSRGSGMNLQMSFQTTKFMDREWVDREQLEEATMRARREGARDGAREGANMAIDRLMQSPRTRKRVGI